MNTLPIKAFLLFLCAGALPCNGAEKSRLITQLEAGKKQVVVAYGTSLTSDGAWVTQMTGVLNQRFPGLVTVINSGGSGRWSGWGVTNLQEKVLRKRPDTVFIEFAINDCAEHFKGTVEVARNNLETMIDSIRETNPQCEIILMTMTPGNGFREGHRSYRKGIEGYYEMYRSVARARKLMLIDHYPNWKALENGHKSALPAICARYDSPNGRRMLEGGHAGDIGCLRHQGYGRRQMITKQRAQPAPAKVGAVKQKPLE